MGLRRRESAPAWSARDDVLLHTCRVGAAVTSGDASAIPGLTTSFRPSLADDDVLWATAPYIAYDFRALGDGSWQTSGVFVGGTGALGFGLVAGSLAGGAIQRRRARSRARSDAVPRWIEVHRGQLCVGRHGFYFQTPNLLAWGWADVDEALMLAPGRVRLSGTSRNGPIAWVIDSDWAELLFLLWALARHPRHPQLTSGEWLASGWVQHARDCGRAPAAGGDGALLPRLWVDGGGPGEPSPHDADAFSPGAGIVGLTPLGPESVGRPGGPPFWPPPPGWRPGA